MDEECSYVVERMLAQPDRVDELKEWLRRAAGHIRQVSGVHQLVLIQSQQNPAEFIFFLIVDDLPQVDALLDQAEWHRHLVQALPRLISGAPERVVGQSVA
jgi:quinol monooxygenase YgiN